MIADFEQTLAHHGHALRRTDTRVLQLNLGRVCNLACTHCHVTAGPNRKETMSPQIARECIDWIARHRPEVVDLTGGAPELCAEFRGLAEAARAAGARVIVRTNLTVLLEPGQEDLADFFVANSLHVIASLPCYLEENVDAQRGDGTHARSIEALRRLNAKGYGQGGGLTLELVYNPGGATLPPDQTALEADYRRILEERHGVVFDRLICLANMPVGRFASALRAKGAYDSYLTELVHQFNPVTLGALMCRDTISVGWTGEVFDCDFNQMSSMPMGLGPPRMLRDLDPAALAGEPIRTAPHCFGCTAGSGSSCGGALV
jgi:radical SAM/Cys-rich protein